MARESFRSVTIKYNAKSSVNRGDGAAPNNVRGRDLKMAPMNDFGGPATGSDVGTPHTMAGGRDLASKDRGGKLK